MTYCMIIEGYIVGIAESKTEMPLEPISQEQRDAIMSKIQSAPKAPSGYEYRLRASDLEWGLVELPPIPDPELTDEELVEILLGGAT